MSTNGRERYHWVGRLHQHHQLEVRSQPPDPAQRHPGERHDPHRRVLAGPAELVEQLHQATLDEPGVAGRVLGLDGQLHPARVVGRGLEQPAHREHLGELGIACPGPRRPCPPTGSSTPRSRGPRGRRAPSRRRCRCTQRRRLARWSSPSSRTSTSPTWKNPWADLDDEAPDTDPELGKVLTMRRLLETAADYPRRVELAVETKHPTRYAGLVERRLVQLLDEFGWAGKGSPVRVMSFSWVALRRDPGSRPDIDLVMLLRAPTQWYRSKSVRRLRLARPARHRVTCREHPGMIRRIVASGVRRALLDGQRRQPTSNLCARARGGSDHHRQPGGTAVALCEEV